MNAPPSSTPLPPTVGVFLDAYNLAFQTRGVLNQALNYRKLLDYIGATYGHVNLAVAYFDVAPVDQRLLALFGKPTYDALVAEMRGGGWALYHGDQYADEVMTRDFKTLEHLFQNLVLISDDRLIVSAAQRTGKALVILTPADLLPILAVTQKDDETLVFIEMALDKDQKDIAAILLGVRLEKAVDALAAQAGLLGQNDPLAKAIGALFEAKVLSTGEVEQLHKYRRIRNAAVHGDLGGYTQADVAGFHAWLKAWLAQRRL